MFARPLCCCPSWKPAIRNHAGQLNVPVVTFESLHGLKKLHLGTFAEVASGADLIVTLGKVLNFMIGFGDILKNTYWIIQVNAEAAVLAHDAKTYVERDLHQHHVLSAAIIEHLLANPATANQIDSLTFANEISAFTTAHPDAAQIIDGGEIG